MSFNLYVSKLSFRVVEETFSLWILGIAAVFDFVGIHLVSQYLVSQATATILHTDICSNSRGKLRFRAVPTFSLVFQVIT